MDDLLNDIEAGIPFHSPRSTNKKMKKRKQLDALIKFRSPQNNRSSKETPHSSEDELFLPDHQKHLPKKSSYRRWCNYTRHILSFCLVCIFMIVCVGLAYANIELKNEVHDLSSRVADVEKRFSSIEINRVISAIEKLKSRLNLIERWNTSYLHDRLQKLQGDFYHLTNRSPPANEMMMAQEEEDVNLSSKLEHMEEKSTQFSEVSNELDKLSRDAEGQINDKNKSFDKNFLVHLLQSERRENSRQNMNQFAKNLHLFNETLHASTIQWDAELTSLRNEFQNLNQTNQIQHLTDLLRNSSNKTLAMVMTLQSNLYQLRKQIEACKCTTPEKIDMNNTIDSK